MSVLRRGCAGALLACLVCSAGIVPAIAQNNSGDVSPSGNDNDVGKRNGAPPGWAVAGNAVPRYHISSDAGQGAPVGKRFARIASLDWTTGTHITGHGGGSVPPFATVMQSIRADDYRGKRVRLSAQLSATGVSDAASLWMRVEADNGKVLAFDNMESRELRGNTPWQRQAIVLDVPSAGATISFGFLLAGSGQVSAADFQFETVDTSVPTTQAPPKPLANPLPAAPVNLDMHL